MPMRFMAARTDPMKDAEEDALGEASLARLTGVALRLPPAALAAALVGLDGLRGIHDERPDRPRTKSALAPLPMSADSRAIGLVVAPSGHGGAPADGPSRSASTSSGHRSSATELRSRAVQHTTRGDGAAGQARSCASNEPMPHKVDGRFGVGAAGVLGPHGV